MKGTFWWRNRVLLLSGVLIVVSLHLVSAGVRPDEPAARPATVLIEALRPVQSATARLTEGANAIVHDYFDLVNVRQENLRLKAQLAQSMSEKAKLTELEVENRHLADLLELRDAIGLEAVAANVIGSDATGLSRTLVLSQGSAEGLKPGMAVLANEGVVGKIIATSQHASRVLLVDDHNSAVDGFDERSRARGIVAGIVDDGLTMKYVDRSEDLRTGDTVVTSGLDGIFPRGLLVGKVKSVHREGPGLFLTVAIAPAVDFKGLEQVMVLIQQPPKIDQGVKAPPAG